MPKLRSQDLLLSLMKTWDYSVRTLAVHSGTSKSAIGNLTSGARDVCSLEVAKAVSKELQVPLSTLFVMPSASNDPGKSESLVDSSWVAERLGQTTQWVRDQANEGAIPHAVIGRQLRFRPSDINRLVDAAFARRLRPTA